MHQEFGLTLIISQAETVRNLSDLETQNAINLMIISILS